MNEFGLKAKDATIADLGLKNVADAYWNLQPAELVEETILGGEGMLTRYRSTLPLTQENLLTSLQRQIHRLR